MCENMTESYFFIFLIQDVVIPTCVKARSQLNVNELSVTFCTIFYCYDQRVKLLPLFFYIEITKIPENLDLTVLSSTLNERVA